MKFKFEKQPTPKEVIKKLEERGFTKRDDMAGANLLYFRNKEGREVVVNTITGKSKEFGNEGGTYKSRNSNPLI